MAPRGQASSSKLNEIDSAQPQTPRATSTDLAKRLENIENEACDILAERRGDLSREFIAKTVKGLKERVFPVGTDLDVLHSQHPIKRSKNNKGRSSHREHGPGCRACSVYIEQDLDRLIYIALAAFPADERSNKEGQSSSSTTNRKKQKSDRSPRPYKHVYAEASTSKDDGSTMECEICCSDDVLLKNITQCPEGHVFCFTCARRMAESQIGMQRTELPCMSMDGCEAAFTESEARRFLRPETMDLWIRLKARDDISAASIPGMSTCPFCEYVVIIEGDPGDTFECRNPDCYKVTCRSCKKLSHSGLSCEEARRRETLNDRQKAEEELAEALIRRCPKCSMAILKDESLRSCNKMICTKCRVLICYVCRADITTASYAHFDDGSSRGNSSKVKQKCPLYDDTAERHNEDLEAIRKRLGDMAPPVTNIDQRDAARRRKRFERLYGPRANAVPGPGGFVAPNAQDVGFPAGGIPLLDPQLQADLRVERLVQAELGEIEARAERRRQERRLRRLQEQDARFQAAEGQAAFLRNDLGGLAVIPVADRRGGAGIRIGDRAVANAPVDNLLAQSYPPRAEGPSTGLRVAFAAAPSFQLAPDQLPAGSAQEQRRSRNARQKGKASTTAIDLTESAGKGKAKNAAKVNVVADDNVDDVDHVHRIVQDRRQRDAQQAAFAMMNLQHREPIPVKAAVKQTKAASSKNQSKMASSSKANSGQSLSQAIVVDPPSPKHDNSELHVKRLRGGKSYTLDGKSLSSSPPLFVSSTSIKDTEGGVSADAASGHKNEI